MLLIKLQFAIAYPNVYIRYLAFAVYYFCCYMCGGNVGQSAAVSSSEKLKILLYQSSTVVPKVGATAPQWVLARFRGR